MSKFEPSTVEAADTMSRWQRVCLWIEDWFVADEPEPWEWEVR